MTQQTPQPEQYYVAVPVSEFNGDKEQFYCVITNAGTFSSCRAKNFGRTMAAFYLKPISLEERDKEVATAFAEWIRKNNWKSNGGTMWVKDTVYTTTTELYNGPYQDYLQSLNS